MNPANNSHLNMNGAAGVPHFMPQIPHLAVNHIMQPPPSFQPDLQDDLKKEVAQLKVTNQELKGLKNLITELTKDYVVAVTNEFKNFMNSIFDNFKANMVDMNQVKEEFVTVLQSIKDQQTKLKPLVIKSDYDTASDDGEDEEEEGDTTDVDNPAPSCSTKPRSSTRVKKPRVRSLDDMECAVFGKNFSANSKKRARIESESDQDEFRADTKQARDDNKKGQKQDKSNRGRRKGSKNKGPAKAALRKELETIKAERNDQKRCERD